jgi:peptidoglycan hydrolase-like protein with peptidoglycan-binding domain
MSRSTSELRRLWKPACEFEKRTLTMHSGARLSGLNVKVFEAFQALDAIMRSHRYVPRANSPGAWETGAYNCRKITGGSNWSLHAYGIAVDINARTNPYGTRLITDMPFAMVEAIKAIRTKSGAEVFRWGGNYSSVKDAMHYEVVASPGEVERGIDWDTVAMEPPNPNDPRSWPTLRSRDRGPSVAKLHELLTGSGFPDVNKGNVFGARTTEAVRGYQVSRKLDVDGIVGPQTWTALLHDLPQPGKEEPSPFKTETRPIAERPLVKSGSEGPTVEELQRRLHDLGFEPGPIDGIFGPKTHACVKEFQKAHDLQVDGICGPKTWQTLLT